MFRRLRYLVLALALVLSGCAGVPKASAQIKYQATYLDLFDTVTYVVGYAESEEAFHGRAQEIHDEMLRYHQLFDIYHEYEGMNNLKTVNDMAGQEPVQVEKEIIALLKDCKEFYEATGGRVNVAMGSVLSLWHEARNDGINDPVNAYLPEEEELKEAAKHMDMDGLIIDEEASTVFLSDPDMRLDVGAVAKGWSVQRVAESVQEGMLLSVGGNVCATGPKAADGTPWVVGIRKPGEAEDVYLHTVYVSEGCVVTSGDYQRTYAVDGKSYHHIIDPDTLYPSEYWTSVTVVCEDSGIADALSTALFLLDMEAGQKLLDRYGAKALWVDPEGEIFYSPGFEKLIRT